MAFLCVQLLGLTGAKKAVLLGVLLLSLGIATSGFTTHSIAGLFCTASVLTGLGIGLLYTGANTVPVQWFNSRLGRANGIVKLGGGLGGTLTAVVLQKLVDPIRPLWTLHVLGLMVLSTGASSA